MTESSTLDTIPQKKKRRKILKIVLVGLLILLLVTLIAIPLLVMPMFLGQRYEQEQYQAADFAVEAERITLTSDDELKLAAWRTVAEEPQGTVIIAAGELEEIDAVISLSAFSSWTDLFVHYMGEAGVPRPIGFLDAPFIQGYLGFHFGFSALKYSPFKAISKIEDRPVLLMHSTEDNQVPYSQYEKLLSEAQQSNVNVSSFVRQGDWHFVCYDDYLLEPAKDVEFSSTLLDFLDENFS